tara:strand:+ start:445 stop:612 length:168 start_codon:yes stop_codon:yes gene_type:complete
MVEKIKSGDRYIVMVNGKIMFHGSTENAAKFAKSINNRIDRSNSEEKNAISDSNA